MAGKLYHEVLGAELGFAEKSDPWKLESRFFPSKIGGRPAWLDLADLPDPEQLQCSVCSKPLVFLAQIYAPDDDDEGGTRTVKDTCYHRTVYVFVCKDGKCHSRHSSKPFIVFRCQLPKHNKFYPAADPPEDPEWKKEIVAEKYSKICSVCGCQGLKVCGSCKKVNYCSRGHQVLDWKEGHKNACKEGSSRTLKNSFLLPELEIIIEDEKIEVEEENEQDEQRRLKEYEELQREGKTGTFEGDESVDASLAEMAVKGDKYFQKFKKRTAPYAEQVLRYDKGKSPLWVSGEHIPQESDIAKCETCGSRRQFEFQLMPQLLNYLQLDSATEEGVDWGTLAVYTCINNCDEGPAYKREFLWKQDFSSDSETKDIASDTE